MIVQIDLQKDQIDQKDRVDQSGEWSGLSVLTVPNVHVLIDLIANLLALKGHVSSDLGQNDPDLSVPA